MRYPTRSYLPKVNEKIADKQWIKLQTYDCVPYLEDHHNLLPKRALGAVASRKFQRLPDTVKKNLSFQNKTLVLELHDQLS